MFSLIVAAEPQSLCQYANSASATSENSAGSLAVYATGAPDAPQGGNCNTWSGYGYSWSPSNWNVEANLTLNYENPVYASNITITGDYDVCWSGVWLRNSLTGQEKRVLSSDSSTCVLVMGLSEDFQADQVVLQTCGWAWSATDAVQMCGSTASTTPPTCSSSSDCGVDGYVSDPTCSGNNVTRLYQTFTCSNPGTQQSSCSASNSTGVVEGCSYQCSGGVCTQPPIICSQNSDCGIDGYVDNPFCSANNVTRTYQTFTCNNPGTNQSSCSTSNSTAVVEKCNHTCSNGVCTQPVITCNFNSDCGLDGYVSDTTCSGNNVTRLYQTFICSNPGTVESSCSASNSTVVIEQCSYQCVNGACENDTNYTYVVPYIGDIDGAVNSDWFYFYKQLIDFYDTNQINGSFSFYPGTMVDDINYTEAIKKMYLSNYSELIQKGYDGNEDANIDQLPYEQQKALIQKGQDAFRANMSVILGISQSAVIMPITDDQIGARFTDVTRQALEDLGFKFYFDIYVGEGLQPVQPTETFDIIQYAVSFTSTGGAGSDLPFRSKAEIINDIKTYNRTDVPLTYINGHLVVPLAAHQQDFESGSTTNVDSPKWGIYIDTLLTLKNDPDIRLVTPKQVYELRHGALPPLVTCSQNSDCGVDGYVSDPACSGNNVTRLYQTFTCNNPGTNQSSCSASNSTVVVEQCVDQCSNGACQNQTNQTLMSLCQYANSANATSENSAGSLAVYATGAPDAPQGGNCNTWSGYGYSWTPSNWNVKANLTLTYKNPVYASNITITGDYDVCWSGVWLRNSQTGQEKRILSSDSSTCVLVMSLGEDFQADQVVLQTCGWAWSATDAVQMCGTTNQTLPPPPPPPENITNVTVCTWKDCRKGAVSVSVDDTYTSCMPELEANGFRGTYFLTETDTYSPSLWSEFAAGFNKGHELGTHMQDHLCYEVSDSVFYNNIEYNIRDIISNTNAKRDDIITHAYPCGFVGQNYKDILSNNWNFLSARGYYFNQLEATTPIDPFNLKSLNSHGYPGGQWEPPDYFTTVDNAESQGKWANLVFHNECSDDGVINYLPSKNVWVDTIGNVMRYIKLRDASEIYNYAEVGNEIRFNVRVKDDTMNASYYRQNLTMWVPVGSSQVTQVNVNNQLAQYLFGEGNQTNYVIFNIPYPISADVVVTLNSSYNMSDDPCLGIICSDSSVTCPDGFVSTCSNTCSDGVCSQCTPSCVGHDGDTRPIVIVQLDDVQAWWLEDVATQVVNLHIQKGIPITLGVVPEALMERNGISGSITENLKKWARDNSDVIESAVHTYKHDDYTTWTLQQQTDDIKKGKAVFDTLGIQTWIFVPAYNWGNEYTPQAIVNAGLLIGIDALENGYINSMKDPMIIENGAWYGGGYSSLSYSTVSTMIDNNINTTGKDYFVLGYHQQDFQTTVRVTELSTLLDELKASGKYRFMTAKQYYNYKNGSN
ncbi:MAG: hypothetical protein ABIH63_03245 [archaeon]